MKIKGLVGKFLLLPVTALAALVSCVEKPEIPPIYIESTTFHVMQTDAGYMPYFGFQCGGKEEMSVGTMTKDGIPMSLDNNTEYKVSQVDPQDYMVPSLTDLNGEYKFSMTGVKGHTTNDIEVTIAFTGDEDMGEVTVSDFEYNNGTISATFNKVDNATHYGFYIQPYIGASALPTAWYTLPINYFTFKSAGMGETLEMTHTLKASWYANSGITAFEVTPVAFNSNIKGLLVRKADQSKKI